MGFKNKSYVKINVIHLFFILLLTINPMLMALGYQPYEFYQDSHSGLNDDNFKDIDYLEEIFDQRRKMDITTDIYNALYDSDKPMDEPSEEIVNTLMDKTIGEEVRLELEATKKEEGKTKEDILMDKREFILNSMFLLFPDMNEDIFVDIDKQSATKEHQEAFREVAILKGAMISYYSQIMKGVLGIYDLTESELNTAIEEFNIIASVIDKAETAELEAFNELVLSMNYEPIDG